MSSHEDYRRGLRGQSPLTANDAFAWAAGDAARKQKEALESGILQGEEHPNAWQIFILLITVGAGVVVLLAAELLPSILTVSWWRIGGVWLVASALAYFGLKALPDWLAGTIMGILLGGLAAAGGWVWLSPLWAVGLGVGVGAVMYLFFSTLE